MSSLQEKRSVRTIHTIGYEGAMVEDFVATVRSFGVQVLIDIRDVPVSRKPGFSKRALAAKLEDVRIRYEHIRALGNPKPGREAARRGDIRTFERIFRAHLERKPARDALNQALELSSALRACLLCFERDHSVCHRAIVADKMSDREEFEVCHLVVHDGVAEPAV